MGGEGRQYAWAGSESGRWLQRLLRMLRSPVPEARAGSHPPETAKRSVSVAGLVSFVLV